MIAGVTGCGEAVARGGEDSDNELHFRHIDKGDLEVVADLEAQPEVATVILEAVVEGMIENEEQHQLQDIHYYSP